MRGCIRHYETISTNEQYICTTDRVLEWSLRSWKITRGRLFIVSCSCSCGYSSSRTSARLVHQTTRDTSVHHSDDRTEPVRTFRMGYSTRSVPPTFQAYTTRRGIGSGNCPLLHLKIARSSVRIVASRSQQC